MANDDIEQDKKVQPDDVRDPERREALKKMGAIGIAAVTAPAMITLLNATTASAQSGEG